MTNRSKTYLLCNMFTPRSALYHTKSLDYTAYSIQKVTCKKG